MNKLCKCIYKFKEKDSFTFDAENSLKMDDNQILQITKANVHELSYTEIISILRYKHLELEQKELIEKHIFCFLLEEALW